jgi:uncharacterized protein
MTKSSDAPSERTRLRRLHERGSYDSETIYAILDAMPMCHVAYTVDDKPFVTPTLQWREGDRVYWHGSSASQMLRASEGNDICLSVSLLDGLVLARSAFHHSVNFRSVMIFGQPEEVPADQKEARLRAFVDGLYPDRWDSLRPIEGQELKATKILSMPINEASAKVRTGQPVDDDDDYALPIWAGVVPLQFTTMTPEPDPRNLPDLDAPDHVSSVKLG